jgi:hypothetical protein
MSTHRVRWVALALSVMVTLGCGRHRVPSAPACAAVSDRVATRWADVGFIEALQPPRDRLAGTVRDSRGDLLAGALVEVFSVGEVIPGRTDVGRDPRQRRIAACRTRETGRFDFGDLPAGPVELRISDDAEISVHRLYAVIAPAGTVAAAPDIDARFLARSMPPGPTWPVKFPHAPYSESSEVPRTPPTAADEIEPSAR